jgi:hypothetical protein
LNYQKNKNIFYVHLTDKRPVSKFLKKLKNTSSQHAKREILAEDPDPAKVSGDILRNRK